MKRRADRPAEVEGKLYLALVVLPDGGTLGITAPVGEVPDWAGRLTRIINGAELLCDHVADALSPVDERTPDFAELQRAAEAFSAAAKKLHANAMAAMAEHAPRGQA